MAERGGSRCRSEKGFKEQNRKSEKRDSAKDELLGIPRQWEEPDPDLMKAAGIGGSMKGFKKDRSHNRKPQHSKRGVEERELRLVKPVEDAGFHPRIELS